MNVMVYRGKSALPSTEEVPASDSITGYYAGSLPYNNSLPEFGVFLYWFALILIHFKSVATAKPQFTGGLFYNF
ncbi:hypothetical protein MSSIT_2707 [Methanosarcina siciliae T4/M]|uniref:Uncharacterized protein n=1 Tax=Methanosarcina siciliae T4/M TaxID=1434120 RepID=A0A0E3L904_9EURY|nr:hypothetical protein MSSIT_2707 [Methanosarcina siciliae T4/M]